jgi:hypothetical protein
MIKINNFKNNFVMSGISYFSMVKKNLKINYEEKISTKSVYTKYHKEIYFIMYKNTF